MPLQTPRLQVCAIGVSGDALSDEVRQKLVDGIHLRWFFEKNLGFPRHGFYLFRRPSVLLLEERCLRHETGNLPAGPWAAAFLDTSLGQLTSDVNLQLTDEFSWRWSSVVWNTGRMGVELDGRQFLRLKLPEQTVGRADGSTPLGVAVQIGFRQNHGVIGERIEFWRRPAGSGPNPLPEKGVTFRVLDAAGVPTDRTEIREYHPDPPNGGVALSGLDVSALLDVSAPFLEVSLPLPASVVFLRLTGIEGSIEGFAEDGRAVGAQTWRFAEGSFLNAVSLFGSEPMRRVLVRGGFLLHTFTFETVGRTQAGVLVKALHGDAEVARTLAQGLDKQVVRFRLTSDVPITAVEIDSGPAVLTDLCLLAPGAQGVTAGWEKIQDFPYPLSLPVTHPDYPASGHRPVDAAAAQSEALSRVRYGSPDLWGGEGFADLHTQLVALVEGGREPPMAQRSTLVPGTPVTPRPGPAPTVSLRRYPLDSVLLATLHPALAQMVGLYWVDQTAQPGQLYDYLLLAEWNAREIPEFASRDPDTVLAKLHRDGLADIVGFIVFARQLAPPEALPIPGGVEAFALPGGTMQAPDGSLKRAENVAGLRWDLGKTPSGQLKLGSPVMYHLWRADLGAEAGAMPPPADRYRCLTLGHPVLVGGPPAGSSPQYQNTAWPPFRLHALDSGLADGWYSYQVSGIDIFGRHSERSAPGQWRQWAPAPDPRPCYYQDPPGDRAVHPFAVQVVDRLPPPPPAAVEAWALDPKDPLLLRDAAYEAWRAGLTSEEQASVIGLRVRWEWPESLMHQAPDAREFRIYLQPGRLNAVAGWVRAVQHLASQEAFVAVEIAAGLPDTALPGMVMQVAGRAFPVLDVDAGPPRRLHVQGIPPVDTPCALVFPPGHALFVDYRAPTAWTQRYYVVGVGERVTVGVGPDGRPVRRYEVLLPAAGDAFKGGLMGTLAPSLADPIAYALVGVSVADDRDDVADAPQWATGRWGGRAGNEGPVGPPATIFRVLRDPAPPPAPAPDEERVFATRADYHGRSYYTYRWRPGAHLKTHVFRALDDTLFKTDRAQRFNADGSRRPDQPTLDPSRTELFPDPATEPRWDTAKREQVCAELNRLNGITDPTEASAYYRGLSNDGLRILAGLPGNDRAFMQLTIQPLDPDDPTHANRVGPDDSAEFVVNPALRAYLDTLDGGAANRYFYRAAYVDAAHNHGPPSLSSAPVYLTKVVPLRTPFVTKVLGDDRRIVIAWSSNREPDLTEYRVYRAETDEDARDVHTMTLVHTEAVTAKDPSLRPAEVIWSDNPVPGLVTFLYRLVAVDQTGNLSEPSSPLSARAYDLSPPAPPEWERLAWVQLDMAGAEHPWTATPPSGEEWRPAAALTWGTPGRVRTLLQRCRPGTSAWANVTSWIGPGSYDMFRQLWLFSVYDEAVAPATGAEYRIKVESEAGNLNITYNGRQLAPR